MIANLRRCSRPWRRAALDGILPLRDHLDGRTLHVPSNVSNAQIPAIRRRLGERVKSTPSGSSKCTNDLLRPTQSGPCGQARGVLSETAHSQPRAYAKRPSSACAPAISGISGVVEKPSSAGARMACASSRRPVDW